MGLKLIKRGKTYYIRGSVRGEAVFRTTGTSDRTLAEAIRIKTEKNILDESVFGKASVVTFHQAATDYGNSGASLRYVLELYKDGSEHGLATYFGARKLASITQADLEVAARELYPLASPETVNRQLFTPFIAIWNHAFGDQPNMVRKWKRPRKAKGTNVVSMKPARSGKSPIAYDRAAAFLSAMSPAPAMLLAFLFYTGLRPIEAFAMHADDVMLADRWIVVRHSKTGEPRGVPLHDFVAGWLPDLVARGGALFRANGGDAYKPVLDGGGGMKSAIAGARRRSGITGVSPYTARHTVSTQLVINGIHPHIKDQILGHAADSMSRHYTNVPQQPLIDAINTLPVPDAMRALPWIESPKDWWDKLAEGTGKRTDLLIKRQKLEQK